MITSSNGKPAECVTKGRVEAGGRQVEEVNKPQADDSSSSPRVGRPKVLGDMDKLLITTLLQEGVSMRRCAKLVGCVHGTIFNEIQRDSLFAETVRHARIHAETEPLSQIRKAASQSWRAAAWLLERLDKEREEDEALEEEFNAAIAAAPPISKELMKKIERQEAEAKQKQKLSALIDLAEAAEKAGEFDELNAKNEFLTTPEESEAEGEFGEEEYYVPSPKIQEILNETDLDDILAAVFKKKQ